MHTHCLCERCQGRAVSRATEYRHWTAAKREAESFNTELLNDVDEEGQGGRHRRNDGYRERSPTTTIIDTCTSVSSSVNSDDHEMERHAPLDEQEMNPSSSDGPEMHMDTTSTTNVTNSTVWTPRDVVLNDLVWSVVEAFQLVDNTNGSQQNFIDMLKFGKHLYMRGLCINALVSESTPQVKPGDVEAVWPQTWQGEMKLLEEEGYQHPKKLSVCLSDSHYFQWDVMSEGERCRHCGESGEIPYYYLSLSNKVILIACTHVHVHCMHAVVACVTS